MRAVCLIGGPTSKKNIEQFFRTMELLLFFASPCSCKSVVERNCWLNDVEDTVQHRLQVRST